MKGVQRLLVLLMCEGLNTGCFGTMDTVHTISGIAPEKGDCSVEMRQAEEGSSAHIEKVNGAFKVSHTVGGPIAATSDILVACDGVTLKELTNVNLRRAGDIDLGILEK